MDKVLSYSCSTARPAMRELRKMTNDNKVAADIMCYEDNNQQKPMLSWIRPNVTHRVPNETASESLSGSIKNGIIEPILREKRITSVWRRQPEFLERTTMYNVVKGTTKPSDKRRDARGREDPRDTTWNVSMTDIKTKRRQRNGSKSTNIIGSASREAASPKPIWY